MKRKYAPDGLRQICEDYFPHTCETCEFEFVKGGPYCPKEKEIPCSGYGISFEAFCVAMERWKKEHPGQEY